MFLSLCVSALVIILLSIDVFLRWRIARVGVKAIYEWNGLIPSPILAVVGAVSTIGVGWVGWTLTVSSLFLATTAVKFSRPSGNEQTASLIDSIIGEIILGCVLVSELGVIGVASKVFVSSGYVMLLEVL